MKLIGLTGGIGCGKSFASTTLERAGVVVIDTDVVAREVVAPGQPALQEIAREFGSEVVEDSGQLRRSKLAEIVFADAAKRAALERILHPRIRDRWLATVASWRREARTVGVVVIPLLFETNAQAQFDAVICVACTPVSQRDRLSARGWTDIEIDRRLASQWSVGRKIEASDHVIWAEGSVDVHRAQLGRLFSSFGVELAPG